MKKKIIIALLLSGAITFVAAMAACNGIIGPGNQEDGTQQGGAGNDPGTNDPNGSNQGGGGGSQNNGGGNNSGGSGDGSGSEGENNQGDNKNPEGENKDPNGNEQGGNASGETIDCSKIAGTYYMVGRDGTTNELTVSTTTLKLGESGAYSCDWAGYSGSGKVSVNNEIYYVALNSIEYSVALEENAILKLTSAKADAPAVTLLGVNKTKAQVDGDAELKGKLEALVPLNVIAVETVTIYGTSPMTVGDSLKFTASVTPANATYKDVTWSSSNTKIATVDGASGTVNALSEGTAVITATAHNNVKKNFTLTVNKAAVAVTGVSITNKVTALTVGDTAKLNATVSPADATNKSVNWSSSNSNVVAVDASGNLTAKAAGTATITVTTVNGSRTDSCTITVSPKVVSVTGVSITNKVTALTVDDTAKLNATVSPADATNKSVSWSSSNSNVVAVDASGNLTAKAAGTATITVTTADGKRTDTCAITVSAKTVAVTGVSLNNTTLEMHVGENDTLTATVTPSNATNKSVSWSSNDSGVVSVDGSGNITAKSSGSARITVTTADGGFTASCTVTVAAANVSVTGVSISKNSLSLYVGEYSSLSATVTPSNATNKAVSWSSSNTAVVTVDASSGSVHAVGTGTASVTVTTADGNFTAACAVTVSAQPTPDIPAAITYSYAGEECAAFEWSDSNAQSATAYYKLHSASTYTQVDSQLIRQKSSGTARVDVVGLKGGEVYDFKITASSGSNILTNNILISSYDRSGYAHFGASDGVGAYNNDGTLKSNAVVVYVTEANKNTVTARVGGSNKTGLVNILKAATNGTPLVMRIVGTVGSATWNSKTYPGFSKSNPLRASDFVANTSGNGSLTLTTNTKTSYTQDQLISGGFNTLNTTPDYYNGATCLAINGLNSKIMCSQDSDGYWNYDSCWNDCSLESLNNVTVEGIGDDAEIFQWGFTFKKSKSIEVRNLHFLDYTEDACSFEGDSDTSGATSLSGFKTYERIWIHHNTFDEGKNYWDVCDEQDKGDGDGSTDLKGVKNVTLSYNTYIRTHKTGLVGGSDKTATASVTFHHNYYNNCNQRMPLGRQANMHMYNNYYSDSSLYSISLRGGAYAFIENCVFTEDASIHYPLEIVSSSSGKSSAKIVNCSIAEEKIKNAYGSAYLYVGDDRLATVNTSDQRFAADFDTNSSTFYYDAATLRTNVTHMMNTADVATVIPQVAGVQRAGKNVSLAQTGNLAVAGAGGSSGSGQTELTMFEQLRASSDKVFAEDFSGYQNGDKLPAFVDYTTGGVYSKSNSAAAYADDSNCTVVSSGKAVHQSTNNSNTETVIAFGTTKKQIEGYFEMSTDDIGSKWDLIRFMNGSNVVAAIRIPDQSTNPLVCAYYSGGAITDTSNPSTSFVWAKNTLYKIHYTVNLNTGVITVDISGGGTLNATMNIGSVNIGGITIMSSNKGARHATMDNVVICAK